MRCWTRPRASCVARSAQAERPMDEFHLIRRYFGSHPATRDDVTLGIGDNSAHFAVPAVSGAAGPAGSKDPCVRRFAFPEPRVNEGMALRRLASAVIDVSDGLLADLGHLLEASGVGASIEIERLPLSKRLLELHGAGRGRELALTG